MPRTNWIFEITTILATVIVSVTVAASGPSHLQLLESVDGRALYLGKTLDQFLGDARGGSKAKD